MYQRSVPYAVCLHDKNRLSVNICPPEDCIYYYIILMANIYLLSGGFDEPLGLSSLKTSDSFEVEAIGITVSQG